VATTFKKAVAHQRYRLSDGTLVPGVTTIVGLLNKPQLVSWANRLGLQGIDASAHVQAAAGAGTCAHEMIQEVLGGPAVDLSKYSGEEIAQAQNAASKFKAWLAEHAMETQAIEMQLVSERHRVGGTIDWYGMLDGLYTLVDLKTSGRVYDEHIIQVAAYARLMEEADYEIDRVRILRFSRDDDSSQRDMTLSEEQLRVGWEIFKHLRDIYDLKQNIKVA
jgi:hypothetical protein